MAGTNNNKGWWWRMRSLFVPAREIGLEASNELAERWWSGASAANWLGGRHGQRGLPLTYSDWTWPIYDAAEATTTLIVRRSLATWDSPAAWQGPSKSAVAYQIPWNPKWRAATAEDGGILIRHDHAVWWSILNLRQIKGAEAAAMNLRCWWEADWATKLAGRTLAVNPGDRQADGLGYVTPNNATSMIGRGIGNVPKHVGILTADMLRHGVDQALSVTACNVQFGRGATFRSPATRIEHTSREQRRGSQRNQISATIPEGDHSRMIPAGLRMVLDRPRSEIDAWIAAKPADQRVAARNLTDGLCEYGMFQGETSDGDTQMECEGIRNPTSAGKFAALGLRSTTDFARFLDGLITGPADLRVVKEAM